MSVMEVVDNAYIIEAQRVQGSTNYAQVLRMPIPITMIEQSQLTP